MASLDNYISGKVCIQDRMKAIEQNPTVEPGMLEYLMEQVGEGDTRMTMKELYGNMIELLSAGIDTVNTVSY